MQPARCCCRWCPGLSTGQPGSQPARRSLFLPSSVPEFSALSGWQPNGHPRGRVSLLGTRHGQGRRERKSRYYVRTAKKNGRERVKEKWIIVKINLFTAHYKGATCSTLASSWALWLRTGTLWIREEVVYQRELENSQPPPPPSPVAGFERGWWLFSQQIVRFQVGSKLSECPMKPESRPRGKQWLIKI